MDGNGVDTPTQTASGGNGGDQPTQVSSSNTSAPSQGQDTCKATTDCGATICTGHTVQACRDGKCVCDSPPEETSSTVTSKPSATPTQTQTQIDPSSSQAPPEETPRTCNLHLHEYAQSSSDTSIVVDYSFDNGKGGTPFQGTFTKNWNEEYQVPTVETGLDKPISVTLTDQLPPGVVDTDCPVQGGGGTGGGNGAGVSRKRCAKTQWKLWLVQLKYGDLAWDSQVDQDLTKTPHCQVGDWDMNGWDGINQVDPNRQMDCRFSC